MSPHCATRREGGADGSMDCTIVVSFDLSTELVFSGQLNYPEFLNAMARIEAAIAMGCQKIAGLDVIWLKNAIQISIKWTGGGAQA
jgi:hypothetical protein